MRGYLRAITDALVYPRGPVGVVTSTPAVEEHGPARFQDILSRHGLVEAWRRFERQFLGDAP